MFQPRITVHDVKVARTEIYQRCCTYTYSVSIVTRQKLRLQCCVINHSNRNKAVPRLAFSHFSNRKNIKMLAAFLPIIKLEFLFLCLSLECLWFHTHIREGKETVLCLQFVYVSRKKVFCERGEKNTRRAEKLKISITLFQ